MLNKWSFCLSNLKVTTHRHRRSDLQRPPGARAATAMDVEHGVRVLAERPAEDFEPTEEEADGLSDRGCLENLRLGFIETNQKNMKRCGTT